MSAAPHLRPVPDLETGEIREHEACAECAALRGQLFALEQDNRRIEKDLRAWREKYERAQEDREQKVRNDKHFPAALGLFEEWATETRHPNARFDTARINLALRAIKLYHKDRDKLTWVVLYGKHFAYVDDRGVRHDSFGLLFRDAEHIEKYANTYWRRRGEVTP